MLFKIESTFKIDLSEHLLQHRCEGLIALPDFRDLFLGGLVLTLDLIKEFSSEDLGLLMDLLKLRVCELLLSVDPSRDVLLHVFDNLSDRKISLCFGGADQENLRERLVINGFGAENLDELLVECRLELVYVVQLVLHDDRVSLSNDSNEEVHKAYQEDDNVDHIEDDPDTHDH